MRVVFLYRASSQSKKSPLLSNALGNCVELLAQEFLEINFCFRFVRDLDHMSSSFPAGFVFVAALARFLCKPHHRVELRGVTPPIPDLSTNFSTLVCKT